MTEDHIDRVPPHSLEAETGLLGAALLEPTRVLDLCIEHKLNEDAFYVPANRIVFRAMGELLAMGQPVDVLTVGDRLRKRNKLEAVGGALYIDRLIDNCSTPAHAEHYITMLRQDWLRRKIVETCREAEQLAYEVEDPELLRSKAEMAFTTLHERRGEKTLKSVWRELLADIEAGMSGSPRQIGVDTGIKVIDDKNPGGMRAGSIYWLTGKQKSGKTRLKRNIVTMLLGGGRKIADCVLEGTLEDEVEGLANILLDTNLSSVMMGLSTRGVDKLLRAQRMIVESGLLLAADSSEVRTTVEFRSWARRQVKKNGAEIVMLDYLQRLMVPEPGKKGMEEITAEKVQCLEQTAQELGVPLLVIAAISEEGNVRGSRYADYTGSAHWQLSRGTDKTIPPNHWVALQLWVKEARYALSDQYITLRMNGKTGLIEAGRLTDGQPDRGVEGIDFDPQDELAIA